MGCTRYKAIAWVAASKYAYVVGMVLWSELRQDGWG
jgi:hypothetical protein